MANDSTYPSAGDRSPSACAQREEHWRRVLARQRQSGLTKRNFSRREEISESALAWWGRELARRDGAHAPARKRKTRRKTRAARPAFVPVHVIQALPAATASAIEVVTRGGHVVRLRPDFDPATLRKVVAALEGQPSFAEASEDRPC